MAHITDITNMSPGARHAAAIARRTSTGRISSLRTIGVVLLSIFASLLASPAFGQGLLEQAARPASESQAAPGGAEQEPGSPGRTMSPDQTPGDGPDAPSMGNRTRGETRGAQAASFGLFTVVAPTPRSYMKHDLVEIIINESTLQSISHTSDLKKDSTLRAELSRFPSLEALLKEATLTEGIGSVKPGIGVTSTNNFKGEGKVNRRDQITARITATVIDVKPNGNLVLEARESIQSDREISTMVITGVCRAADITRNNTVQSSQLAGMNLRIENEGDAKDTADKGLIPRVLETIFNF